MVRKSSRSLLTKLRMYFSNQQYLPFFKEQSEKMGEGKKSFKLTIESCLAKRNGQVSKMEEFLFACFSELRLNE